MKTKAILIFTSILFMGITSCQKGAFIRGNKSVTTVERGLSEFDKVANNGSFEVKIYQSDESRVIIEAESNLIEYIDTQIHNGALIVDSDKNLLNRRPMKVYVYTDSLRAIELNGSGFIHTETFSSPVFSAVLDGSGDIKTYINSCQDAYYRISGSGNMDVDIETEVCKAEIQGSGDLDLDGSAEESEYEIHGSGSIKAYDLTVDNNRSVIDGSGSIYVWVSEYLDAKIFGSGSIYYAGNPSDINKEIDGSGSIIKK